MKIVATKVRGEELKPGDLFSTADQLYWDHYDPLSIGEKVYIRTEAPCPPDQKDDPIYRITIEEEG